MATLDWEVIAGVRPAGAGDLTHDEYGRYIRVKLRQMRDLHASLQTAERRAANLKGWVAFLACALGYVALRYFGLG